MNRHTDVRLSLPSRGRLSEAALDFLAACGLEVDKPNPRQYAARIAALPGLTVLFQRPGDIVVSVRDGSVDFGITGMDMVAERRGENGDVLVLHDALGFGHCRLCLAVPESWQTVRTMADLASHTGRLARPLRVATKFPRLTGGFLSSHGVSPFTLIPAEGTLEVAPTIGYADLIADLVSSGQTLRDNRLRLLEDGAILCSQAALIANREALQARPEVLDIARQMLEFAEAHLRAVEHVSVFANMRGPSPQAIAEQMFAQDTLGGLQGPTISPVVVRQGNPNWYAVHIVVRRQQLFQAIAELRAIGGSGVVVTPVTYVFEEEPARYRAMMQAIQEGQHVAARTTKDGNVQRVDNPPISGQIRGEKDANLR
jgi:ATP phosphoribosyltransferase